MSKSNLRPPVIADNSTRTAINELYKQVNKLLTSISSNAQNYAGDVLEGSVRAIYNGNNTFRIEGYTSKGWVGVTAQKQSGPNTYRDMPIISDNGHLKIFGLTVSNLSEIASDTDKFLMSDNGEIKFVTGTNLRTYIGAGTSNVASLNDLSDVTFGSGALSISGLTSLETASNFEIESLSTSLNSSQNIVLDAANTAGVVGGGIKFETNGDMFANFSSNETASRFELYQKGGTEPDAGDASLDRLLFTCLEHGSSRITAIDTSGGNLANLRIRAFGNVEIQATNKIKFSQDTNSTFENYISPFAATLIFG